MVLLSVVLIRCRVTLTLTYVEMNYHVKFNEALNELCNQWSAQNEGRKQYSSAGVFTKRALWASSMHRRRHVFISFMAEMINNNNIPKSDMAQMRRDKKVVWLKPYRPYRRRRICFHVHRPILKRAIMVKIRRERCREWRRVPTSTASYSETIWDPTLVFCRDVEDT